MVQTKQASVAFVLALCLLFAACSRPSGGSQAPAASRRGAAPATLRLAYAQIPDGGLVQVALAQGFFAAEGLAVQALPFAFGKPALEALLRGEADLVTVAETPLVFAIMGGAKIKIAAVIGTADKNAAIVADLDSGIRGPGDLVGKSVAVTKGTTGEFYLGSFLVASGLRQDGVKMVDMQPAEMLGALKSGRVAAAATWNPALLQIATGLGAKALMLYGEGIYTENFCLAGSASFLEARPEEMKAFMRALLKAEAFMKKSPDAALRSISTLIGTDEASLRPAMQLFSFRLSLDQTLLLVLEDETRWAIRLGTEPEGGMPRYLDYLYTYALAAVAPERMRLIR